MYLIHSGVVSLQHRKRWKDLTEFHITMQTWYISHLLELWSTWYCMPSLTSATWTLAYYYIIYKVAFHTCIDYENKTFTYKVGTEIEFWNEHIYGLTYCTTKIFIIWGAGL